MANGFTAAECHYEVRIFALYRVRLYRFRYNCIDAEMLQHYGEETFLK